MEDSLEKGFRVGILSNSDGHKGRPGASHPGASKFGSYGGLTCLLSKQLTRQALAESLRKRHHYGTTGCRMVLDVTTKFENPALLFEKDPHLGEGYSESVHEAMMGDILQSADQQVTLVINAVGSAPIEQIEIRNGLQTLEVFRPYKVAELGRRIRVVWEGSEYRGRGRETNWDGGASLSGNSFASASPINRYNLDKRFDLLEPHRLEWDSITTGGHAGFEAMLTDSNAGVLSIETNLVKVDIPVADISYDELVFEAGGLGRKIRVFRLPDENMHTQVRVERQVTLVDDRDNALYVRIIQEDGHVIWSSPTYIFR